MSTEPADVPMQGLPQFALVAAAALVLVPGAIFIVIAIARGSFPVGRIRRIQDVEWTQTCTAIGYGCLVAGLTLAMATTFPAVAGFYAAVVLAWALWNVPPTARRIQYRLRIVARSTPEAAFALVSDPRNWHSYLPALDVFGQLDLPLHIGSVVLTTFRQGRSVISEEEQVVAYDPGRRFGTASRHRRPTDGVYEMARIDEGTEIVWTYWTVLPYSFAVLALPFSRGATRERIIRRRQESLEAIKRLLEAPTPVSV
ncbi:MAG TPA: SRPBCC family protein [Candidatus Dormibacteraeota bacterium]|nr:SRPBCC family protein [Candidatus Dormibacteraeota bacterium]